MFGRRKKPAVSAPPSFGLADLAGPDGTVPLPPDGVPAQPVSARTPEDVAGTYRAAGVDLPGLAPRRSPSSGVTVWRSVPADPEELVPAWPALRELHPRTGLWPLLVGAEFWERFGDVAAEPETDRGDGASWLRQRLTAGAGGPLSEQIPRRAEPPWQPVENAGWPDVVGADGPVEEIVLVPAAASWLVPAALAWDGAVNHEILGPEHTTVLRRWSARYGAELVTLGSDTMMLRVADPPADRDAALLAAVEATAYCSDAVFQGVGSLEALAEVLTAQVWFFWWD